jgi:hypothetical protein
MARNMTREQTAHVRFKSFSAPPWVESHDISLILTACNPIREQTARAQLKHLSAPPSVEGYHISSALTARNSTSAILLESSHSFKKFGSSTLCGEPWHLFHFDDKQLTFKKKKFVSSTLGGEPWHIFNFNGT